MVSKTSEETKEEMIQKMGEEFGSLFYSLYNEITWLTFKWIEFKELFGTKESRIEIMNNSAPFFFYTVQKVLWENLLLGVARITDPPKSLGKRNTSLRSLSKFIEDVSFKAEIEKELEEILIDSKFCRDWRNRWIVHLDYELGVIKENAIPLELATRLQFKESIEKVHHLYNKVSLKFLGSSTAWHVMRSNRGAVSLLYQIENGINYNKEKYKKMEKGDWKSDDFKSLV